MKKKKKIFIKIIKFFSYFVALLIVLAAIVTIRIFSYFLKVTPDAQALATRRVQESSVIYDSSGTQVLYEIHGDEDRKIVSHEDIPDIMRVSTIAIEDDNFYNHKGFDLAGILRSAFINAKSNDIKQGGSTITQQLARNAFLSRDRTVDRKLKELALAIKIEKLFSKDEILDTYLNEVSYGSNIYGVQRAAEVYYHKDAKDLELDEAAVLAALTKAPSYYSPYGDHKNELEERQKFILNRIEELGLETKESVELAKTKPIKIYQNLDPIQAPHFVFFVIEELEKQYGKEFVEQGGLKIVTTLDLDLQKKAEETVKNGVTKNSRYNAENAALVAMNPANGEILAMVGSRDYFDKTIDGQVNVANRPRQPGSAFKPIAYAKAFEKGFQPETMLYDVPTDFGPDGSGKNYTPGNYGNTFRGLVSMREALAMSLNIPAVKTLYLAGVNETVDFAEKLGIKSLSGGREYGLSLVLGGGEITLLEGVSAYSVFANDGVRQSSTPIKKITRRTTNEEIEYHKEAPNQVISSETARKINSILSDNAARGPVFGPHSSLYVDGLAVAAKTGTTQEYRDAWTIGYTPKIAVGVWAGNNDNTPMKYGAAGIFAAAPIWNEFMKTAIQHYSLANEAFPEYTKVSSDKKMIAGGTDQETVLINTKTGKEISQSKAKKTAPEKVGVRFVGERHSILFYVDKDNPLFANGPNIQDPMLVRWEKSLNQEELEQK